MRKNYRIHDLKTKIITGCDFFFDKNVYFIVIFIKKLTLEEKSYM